MPDDKVKYRLLDVHELDWNLPVLQVERLSREGLPPISFRLAAGELVCLSGPSGCGKTQLLRAIADLDVNTGEIRLQSESREAIPAPQWRRRVALLSAESRWWAPTVGDHFPVVDRDDFESLGFSAEDVAGWKVERLSSGEKQRLALLRLLSGQPKVLLLDEPTANLDNDNARRVEALVKNYLQTRQAACLWVSHDEAQIGRIAERRLYMNGDGLKDAA